MSGVTTTRAIADITDEGLFERLATAVLRAAKPVYGNLGHPGVNADGKTVKSPLDGIHFEPGACPPHLIAVNHTTAGIEGLEGKWLYDPSKVKPRKAGGTPTAPAGDLLKTATIVAEERMACEQLFTLEARPEAKVIFLTYRISTDFVRLKRRPFPDEGDPAGGIERGSENLEISLALRRESDAARDL